MPGLEDLYREIILDHYKSPRNRGTLETPPAHVALGHNPLCGDEIQVFLVVDDGVVSDIKIGAQGCSISQASASMMSSAVKGKAVGDARRFVAAFRSMLGLREDGSALDETDEVVDYSDVKLGDLEALKGVTKYHARIKCATLGWNTFTQALDSAQG